MLKLGPFRLGSFLFLLLLFSLSLAHTRSLTVSVEQRFQRPTEMGEDFIIYETKYTFSNPFPEPFSLVDRNFAFLTSSGEIIDESTEWMKTEGILPPKGKLEWIDYPYIAKRWADEALKKNSRELILRQYFRLKKKEEIVTIHCDTLYILDPSQISNVFLPPKIVLERSTKKPIPLDARNEKGIPILPWVIKGYTLDNPELAKIDEHFLVGLQIGTTTIRLKSSKVKVSAMVEITPNMGDTKVLPPLLRLLPGEKRFVVIDNFPPGEITGFVIKNKEIATRGEILSPVKAKENWDVKSALEEDIKAVEELVEGKNYGTTRLIVRGLKSKMSREGEVEVVQMKDKPMNYCRIAIFIFRDTEVEVDSKKESLSYKPEEIEGIKEAIKRFSDVIRYFTAGNFAVDTFVTVVDNQKILNELIEDTKVYGYRFNMYKAQELLKRLSEEHFHKPLSYFDDVVVCSPMPKAGAAWGGWEFNVDGGVVRGLYIPNYWRENTPLWGDMVEVLVHEWIHCLEGHIVHSGLEPIPSADGGAVEGEILSHIKAPTFRRPKDTKTWMPYYLHILRDFLTSEDWAKLQTSYNREIKEDKAKR